MQLSDGPRGSVTAVLPGNKSVSSRYVRQEAQECLLDSQLCSSELVNASIDWARAAKSNPPDEGVTEEAFRVDTATGKAEQLSAAKGNEADARLNEQV